MIGGGVGVEKRQKQNRNGGVGSATVSRDEVITYVQRLICKPRVGGRCKGRSDVIRG